MYTNIAAVLLLDQLVIGLLLWFKEEWVSEGERWFGLVGQPTSSLVAIAVVLVLAWRTQATPLGLVIGGAVSNLVTYSVYGRAVDYLPVYGTLYTNLADAAIVLGLLWFGWQQLTGGGSEGGT